MLEHFIACERLSLTMLQAICVSLGLGRDHLRDCFKLNHTSYLRLNYYPVRDSFVGSKTNVHSKAGMGGHHHTDAGALTILYQDQIGGLQVLKDNHWYPVDL